MVEIRSDTLRWYGWRVRCWLRRHTADWARRAGVVSAQSTWPLRRWVILIACVATVSGVAVMAVAERGDDDPSSAAAASAAAAALARIPVIATRISREDYERSAFGSAWSDAAPVSGGGNGCDTRNDILRRDLAEVTTAATDACAEAVQTGEFRSPYTGDVEVFRRDRAAAVVQIDHIVALAYAWDLGAWAWTPTRRLQLANDPANLVAVDAKSNQAKSDAEPAQWMPPLRGFRCRYAIQIVRVLAAYGLPIDEPSRRVLVDAVSRC